MRRSTFATVAGAFASGLLVAVAASSTPATSSYLYDLETIKGELSAGTWQTTPALCDEVLERPHATVVAGTEGVDKLLAWKLPNGNHPQVILGLGADDVLKSGNQNDCLVGGDGNDLLGAVGGHHENGKDILLGGPGDDVLFGGNGKDFLDGGPGNCDICVGDKGKDTFRGCEWIFDIGFLPFGLNAPGVEDKLGQLLLLQEDDLEPEGKTTVTPDRSRTVTATPPDDAEDDALPLPLPLPEPEPEPEPEPDDKSAEENPAVVSEDAGTDPSSVPGLPEQDSVEGAHADPVSEEPAP